LAIGTAGVAIAAAVVVFRANAEGGLTSLLASRAVPETYLDPMGDGASFVLWLLVPTVMYTLIGQDFYQRLFAARDARTARTAALVGGTFLVAVSVLPSLAGMGARALAPQAMEPGEALPWVLRELMHPALGGVILAAVLAAIMSTADSLLTSATSHVVNDVYIQTLGRGGEVSDARLLRMSRWVTIGVGAVALAIGIGLPAVVTTLIYSYTMYTAGVLVPVIGGVVWRRANRSGALAAALAGSAVALVGIVGGVEVAGAPTEVYAALVSAAVFVVVSLSTRS
jgi:SSS family solute:Na+ symporter